MYQEAVIFLETASEAYEESIGLNNVAAIGTAINLANVYHDLGRLDEASDIYVKALEAKDGIPLESRGADLVETNLQLWHNLGTLLTEQGQLQEAETLQQRAIDGFISFTAVTTPITLFTVFALAALNAKKGEIEVAQSQYQRALAGFKAAEGEKSEKAFAVLNNMGMIYMDQGQLEKAEDCFQQSLAGLKTQSAATGITPPLLTLVQENMGSLCEETGRKDEAAGWYQDSLTNAIHIFGDEHPRCTRMNEKLEELKRH